MRKATRNRLTGAQGEDLREAILGALASPEDRPATVRAIYYRVVSAGAIPKDDSGYRMVQRRLTRYRTSGEIPHEWIVDGSRVTHETPAWPNVHDALCAIRDQYRRDRWETQSCRVEIWSEKDALSQVLLPVAREWQVPYRILRGYTSLGFGTEVARGIARDGRPTVVLHIGDHDPSGVDAWRALRELLTEHAPNTEFRFERVAVRPGQIDDLGLIWRNTKMTDTRAERFVEQYGARSVEADAIPIGTLKQLLREAIEPHIDHAAWAREVEQEGADRRELARIVDSV